MTATRRPLAQLVVAVGVLWADPPALAQDMSAIDKPVHARCSFAGHVFEILSTPKGRHEDWETTVRSAAKPDLVLWASSGRALEARHSRSVCDSVAAAPLGDGTVMIGGVFIDSVFGDWNLPLAAVYDPAAHRVVSASRDLAFGLPHFEGIDDSGLIVSLVNGAEASDWGVRKVWGHRAMKSFDAPYVPWVHIGVTSGRLFARLDSELAWKHDDAHVFPDLEAFRNYWGGDLDFTDGTPWMNAIAVVDKGAGICVARNGAVARTFPSVWICADHPRPPELLAQCVSRGHPFSIVWNAASGTSVRDGDKSTSLPALGLGRPGTTLGFRGTSTCDATLGKLLTDGRVLITFFSPDADDRPRRLAALVYDPKAKRVDALDPDAAPALHAELHDDSANQADIRLLIGGPPLGGALTWMNHPINGHSVVDLATEALVQDATLTFDEGRFQIRGDAERAGSFASGELVPRETLNDGTVTATLDNGQSCTAPLKAAQTADTKWKCGSDAAR